MLRFVALLAIVAVTAVVAKNVPVPDLLDLDFGIQDALKRSGGIASRAPVSIK